MAPRTKKQHFVPRFYLANFCDRDGYLWTHDSRRGEAMRTLPENTGLETNIYSPEKADGERVDEIEKMLAKIEGVAAPLVQRLLNFEELEGSDKSDMALFVSSMFVRSPAQIRQAAGFMGDIFNFTAARVANLNLEEMREKSENTETQELLLEMLSSKDMLTSHVDRRVGLMSFKNLIPIAKIIQQMSWCFEISKDEELITSDNPVFWIPIYREPRSPYGFGLSNRNAVIPFPLSPSIILRIEHNKSYAWEKQIMSRERAKIANRYQAKYKDHCLYYKTHHDGLHKLGMKYAIPVQQLDSGVQGPNVQVVRKIKS